MKPPTSTAVEKTLPTHIAFVNAHIVTAAGEDIPKGTLIINNGKIEAVLATDKFSASITAIDMTGKTIMPGLVDSHSHIGGAGAADGSATMQPETRVYDSINVRDSGFKRALAGGLTTINIMPGSGHLLSGQTVYVKIRQAQRIEDMAYRFDDGSLMGAIKMANGTNPMREPPFTGTRGKAAAVVRQTYINAQEYAAKVKRAETAGKDGKPDPEKMPARDLAMESLNDVLSGKKIVQHHTHRADDITTVMRLADEFNFRVVLHHVSEAYKIADLIKESKHVIGCSVILVDSPGGKLEASQMRFDTAAQLDRAGVLVGFHTDDWITDSRLFLRMASLGIRAGLPRDTAVKALTINNAKFLDLDKRIGSLEVGKDADFVILSGDPFSVYTKVEQTWVEGVKMFDRANPADRLYAEGGYGAGHDQSPYFCCFDDGTFQFGRSGASWQAGGEK